MLGDLSKMLTSVWKWRKRRQERHSRSFGDAQLSIIHQKRLPENSVTGLCFTWLN